MYMIKVTSKFINEWKEEWFHQRILLPSPHSPLMYTTSTSELGNIIYERYIQIPIQIENQLCTAQHSTSYSRISIDPIWPHICTYIT